LRQPSWRSAVPLLQSSSATTAEAVTALRSDGRQNCSCLIGDSLWPKNMSAAALLERLTTGSQRRRGNDVTFKHRWRIYE
jgi:hypothetical protein